MSDQEHNHESETPEEELFEESEGVISSGVDCPVCGRVLSVPVPETCPECAAPITEIRRLIDLAENSLIEAERDIRIGDFESVRKRLGFVRIASKEYRLHAEILNARLESMLGMVQQADARIKSVRENAEDLDGYGLAMLESVESDIQNAFLALASCSEHYNFALFSSKRGHYEDAISSLKKGLSIMPHHAESHALIGKNYLQISEDDLGVRHLRRSLELDPGNRSASGALSSFERSRPLDMKTAALELYERSPEIAGWAGSVLAILIIAVLAITGLFGG